MLRPVPSDSFTHSAATAAPLDTVWDSLDRPETWESIGGVDRVFDPIVDGQGRLQGFSFETVAAGKRYLGRATPHERIESRRVAWRVESSDIRGVTTVDLAGDAAGTTIEVTIEVVSRGLFSAMLFPVISGAIGRGLQKAVEEFAAGF
jgi:hypothetical protein